MNGAFINKTFKQKGTKEAKKGQVVFLPKHFALFASFCEIFRAAGYGGQSPSPRLLRPGELKEDASYVAASVLVASGWTESELNECRELLAQAAVSRRCPASNCHMSKDQVADATGQCRR